MKTKKGKVPKIIKFLTTPPYADFLHKLSNAFWFLYTLIYQSKFQRRAKEALIVRFEALALSICRGELFRLSVERRV
jgi:hypothetical protein